MKKSAYSILLMDDVIKAVDEQAYKLGTSRSNLINQILAQNLSCVTPEMRMRDIFDSISEFVNNSLQIQQQRSASLMTMKTALEYKYRPTINYKVELERSPTNFFGTLKISIRTQSNPLITLFNDFFIYRIKLEKACLADKNYLFELNSGCFSRKLINSENMTDEMKGEAIGEYIKHIDRCIKAYFSAPNIFPEISPDFEKEYKEMLKKYII